MDKETLSNYGWIVIAVLVLAVMIALATPFGEYIKDAVWSTTTGLFDVNQNALEAAGISTTAKTDVVVTNKFTQDIQFTSKYATMSVDNGNYTITGDGTNPIPQIYFSTSTLFEPSHKYLVTCSMNGDFTNNDLRSFYARLECGSTDLFSDWNFIYYLPEGPLSLDCRDLYSVIETPETMPSKCRFSINGNFGTSEEASGAMFNVSNINIIDVTDIAYTDYEALCAAMYAQYGGKIEGTQTVSIKQPTYPLESKNVIMFGDSIFGNNGIHSRLNYISKVNAQNYAIGGTTLSNTTPFSLCNITNAMVSGNYATQESNVATGSREEKVLSMIKNTDFSTVDYVIIETGTNDWRRCSSIGTNDSVDTKTVKGAYNTVINNLKEINPNMKIIILTPLYRTEFDANTTPNASGIYLHEVVDAVIEIAEKHNIPVYDMYRNAGINDSTSQLYLTDGTHPTEKMIKNMADIIYEMMQNNN